LTNVDATLGAALRSNLATPGETPDEAAEPVGASA